MSRPYRDAGFVVFMPTLRGENGQPGSFSLFHDEVDDVLAAAEYLGKQPGVAPDRLYIAGHSMGRALALLAAMASGRFRAAASFSGSPDQVVSCRHLAASVLPFDKSDPRELPGSVAVGLRRQLQMPGADLYGSEERHLLHLTSQRTASLARARGLDVEAFEVEGSHDTSVPPAMKLGIGFFKQK